MKTVNMEEKLSLEKVRALIQAVVEKYVNDERKLVDALREVVCLYPGFNDYIKSNGGGFFFSPDSFHELDLPRCCSGIRVTFTSDDCGICISREYFYDGDRVVSSGVEWSGSTLLWAKSMLMSDGIIKE